MKKNLIAGMMIVSLAMTGVFGGVSFAADKAADAKPAVKTEVKADAKAEKKATKKAVRKRALRRGAAKKRFMSSHRFRAVKQGKAAAPDAGK